MAAKKPNSKEPDTKIPELEKVEPIKEEETENDTSTSGPKKRGPYKKRGGNADGPRKRASAKKADAGALTQQIVGIHAMLAIVTGFPELNINEVEGRLLADASISVAEEYGLVVTGKVGAAVQLFAACSFVYGPRALRIKSRMDEQRGTVVEGEFTESPYTEAPAQ